MTETTKRTAGEYITAVIDGDTNRLKELVAEDAQLHNLLLGVTEGREQLIQRAGAFSKAFPNPSVRLVSWAEGAENVIAVRFVATGTHKGEFLGIAPTNKSVEVGGLTMVTLRDGRVVEDFTEFDALGLMTQFGAAPVLKPIPA